MNLHYRGALGLLAAGLIMAIAAAYAEPKEQKGKLETVLIKSNRVALARGYHFIRKSQNESVVYKDDDVPTGVTLSCVCTMGDVCSLVMKGNVASCSMAKCSRCELRIKQP